jgi:hypothetical protein
MTPSSPTCFNLRFLPMDKIDSRLVQGMILLHRQYLLTRHLVSTQGVIVPKLEESLRGGEQSFPEVLEIYNYVFALVDHLVRLQKIVASLPRLNKKDPEVLKFDAAMGGLKEIRNQFQHINNDIENAFTGPLLGAICWGRGPEQFVVSMNDIGRERSSELTSFDTWGAGFPEHFHYLYNGRSYDLQAAIDGTEAFWQWLDTKILVQVDGRKFDPASFSASLMLTIKPVQDHD